MRNRWHPILSGAIITTLILPTCWTQQTFGNDLDNFNNNNNNRYNSNPSDPFSNNNNNRYTTPRYGDSSNSYNRDLNDRSRGGSSNFGNRDNLDTNNVNREFGGTDRQTTSPNPDRLFNNFAGGTRSRDRTSNANPFGARGGPNSFYDSNSNVLIKDATYFIIASRMVRPGAIYRVFVTVTDTPKPLTVRASIARDGVEMSHDSKDIKANVPETLLMRVPPTSVPGEYKLKVEGLYNSVMGGIAFINETRVAFSQRSMTIFVQTDKPVYMQGETVKFRTIPITTELKGFDNAIDVYMLDPNGHIMRRWLSRQSNLGSVSLEYKLCDQPVFGEWKIRIVAQGQVEEGKFEVEEYYQTRFEVNITMPAFFFNTDPYIYGRIMANFTSGAPVHGE
jgi:CD109 antigen